MRRTAIAIVTAAVLVTSTLAAQPPGPGWVQMPDGGWLPRDHPAAQQQLHLQQQPQQPPPPVGPTPTAVVCDYVSPYADRPACLIGDYRIGQLYQFGQNVGLVIGLSMASTGSEIVTVQWQYGLDGQPLQVWAFVNDGSQRPWETRR